MERGARSGGGVEYARLTPYELVFGGDVFEADHFPAIREESEQRGVATQDPARFLLLGTVGRLLRELSPAAEPGAEPAAPGAEPRVAAAERPGAAGPGVVERYGLLLFHAYHFWRFARRLYVLEEAPARRLVEHASRVGEWELVPPHPAGYLQLPRNLFWARVAPAAPPEPVDGCFWTMVGVEDPVAPPYGRLDLLLVLGMRPGRPGFSTIAVGSELVAAPLGHWADADARPEGEDFANILPGGELQRWHALVTEMEVLKLASRVFWYVATHPAAVGAETRPSAGPAAMPHAVGPTALAYRRIGEVDGTGEHG